MRIISIFISIFSFVYGFIMLFTNITKTFFILWMLCSFIFLLVYYLYKFNIVNKIPYLIRKTLFISSVLFLLVVLVGVLDVFNYYYKKPIDNLDYIIVLGALVTKDGPALSTIYRLDEAIDYLKYNYNTKCILTGGKGDNEPKEESLVMADYLMNHNIEKERLIIENKSTSTYENLYFSKNFIDIDNDKVGIVTNNFHICRAVFIAKHLNYKNVYGIPSYSLPINTLSNCIRESVALMTYHIKFFLETYI